nr:trypsin-like peptidase domain-containing protein [Bacteriovorax sp. HI3]
MKKLPLFIFVGLLLPVVSMADICGNTDDREASNDPRVGKLVRAYSTAGCGATLINNSCIVTSGACANSTDYVEFNIPASIAGAPQNSRPEDVYYVDKSTVVYEAKGIGSQWAVMKLQANTITNKLPGEVQGYYKVASAKSKKNDPVKVIQYSYGLNDTEYVRSGRVKPNTNGDVIHYAQSTARGELVKAGIFLLPEIYEHNADTSYGAGGSPIINERTNELVGINTHGGCGASYVVTIGARYTNSGTSVLGSKKFQKAIQSCLKSSK